ncbi:hypothetical protein [Paraglaciecola sp. MB-3u-78]|uniref:hypothetical protein n=1 Tax=Paraglaciecola sp. MB-3u-78 TaxID=2058332 RepID=UPI0012FF2506|nr:hypothetical protein [Paraglaciecola sp. MB-3u-78]
MNKINYLKSKSILVLICIGLLNYLALVENVSAESVTTELHSALQDGIEQGINKAKSLLSNNPANVRREVLTSLMTESDRRKDRDFDTRITKLIIGEYLLKKPETLLLTYEWLLQMSYQVQSADVSIGLQPLLNNEYLSNEDIVLLGVFNVVGFRPILNDLYATTQKKITHPKQRANSTATWVILIMQARYGNQDAIKRVLYELENNYDDIIRVTQKFKDLKLIPSRDVRDYLLGYLFSEKRLPRIKDNVQGSLYASYAAQVLSVIDENFPIKKERFNDADIIKVRRWYEQNKSEV